MCNNDSYEKYREEREKELKKAIEENDKEKIQEFAREDDIGNIY